MSSTPDAGPGPLSPPRPPPPPPVTPRTGATAAAAAAPPPPPPRRGSMRINVDVIVEEILRQLSEQKALGISGEEGNVVGWASIPPLLRRIFTIAVTRCHSTDTLAKTCLLTITAHIQQTWPEQVAATVLPALPGLVPAMVFEFERDKPRRGAQPSTNKEQLRSLLTLLQSPDETMNMCAMTAMSAFASRGVLQRIRLRDEGGITAILSILLRTMRADGNTTASGNSTDSGNQQNGASSSTSSNLSSSLPSSSSSSSSSSSVFSSPVSQGLGSSLTSSPSPASLGGGGSLPSRIPQLTVACVHALSLIATAEEEFSLLLGKEEVVRTLVRVGYAASVADASHLQEESKEAPRLSWMGPHAVENLVCCTLGGIARHEASKEVILELGVEFLSLTASSCVDSDKETCTRAVEALTMLGTNASENIVAEMVDRANRFGLTQVINQMTSEAWGMTVAAKFLEVLCIYGGDQLKLSLGRAGMVSRIIHLARPQIEGGGNLEVQRAAVRCLRHMVSIEELAARTLVTGGLWPLFTHAHSTDSILSSLSSQSLDIIGVSSIADVVHMWTSLRNPAKRQERVVQFLKSMPRLDINAIQPGVKGVEIFSRENLLGEGAFGHVYGGVFERQGVAIKLMKSTALRTDAYIHELSVQANIPPHDNIVRLLGVCDIPPSPLPALVMERGIALSSLLHPSSTSRLASPVISSWAVRLQIALDVAMGMGHLHSLESPLLHLDLKPSNILLTEDFRAKVSDFGLAKVQIGRFDFLNPANTGTLQYMAPEVMVANETLVGFGKPADVYSFAILLWQLAHSSRIPFEEITADCQNAIRRAVLDGQRPKIHPDPGCPAGFISLMQQCWAHSSEARPNFHNSFYDAHTTQSDIISALSRLAQLNAQQHSRKFTKLPSSLSPTEILPHLYVGSGQHAQDIDKLERLGISYVVNLAPSVVLTGSQFYPPTFKYLSFYAQDIDEYDISRHFDDVHAFILQAKQEGKKTLVHCFAGASRSVTMVCMHVMRFKLETFEKAYSYILSRHPSAQINNGFRQVLLREEKKLIEEKGMRLVGEVGGGRHRVIGDDNADTEPLNSPQRKSST